MNEPENKRQTEKQDHQSEPSSAAPNNTVSHEMETWPHADASDRYADESLGKNPRISRLPAGFGRYRVVARLGEGGFGTVYLGQDDELDRKVAIKVPRGLHSQAADFLSEARRLAQLRHPGIVTVHDVCQGVDSCFIVTEFVEGKSLFEVLGEGGLSWEKSVEVITLIADALAYAHARGMIHRDIKPKNIILRPDGSPVVLDFGLALTDLESDAPHGVVKGTPGYMAPEQAQGQAHRVDGRTDIFSLASVLYEMLTGRRAFRADSVNEALRRVIEDDPQPLRQLAPAIPPAIASACARAMSKRMEDRFTTAGDFAAALRTGTTATTAPTSEEGVAVTSAAPAPHPPTVSRPPSRDRRRGAERRHVTIAVFNFETISSEGPIDAEDQHELARSFHRLVAESSDEFGGVVVPTADQEVMVCFGYPTAYEHTAHRAVRAALRVRTAGEAAWIANQEKRFGCLLSVWAVVHSGDVVIEDSGGDRSDGISLTGEARNVIAHLRLAAESNAVSITASTYRRVEGFFDCDLLPPQRVRGVAEPISMFRVLSETNVSNRLDLVDPGNLSELVGRDTELAILADRWEQALEGLGQVVLLIGDAGLGKSRLIREIREYVSHGSQGEPSAVVEIRCSPYYQSTGFFPVIQFFEKHLGLGQADPADRLGCIVGHLEELRLDSHENVVVLASLLSIPLDDRYADLQLSPQRMKELTGELLLAWLPAFSRRQRVLFVVEDLHWVDPSTLDVLSKHVERPQTDQVLTLLTFRPEFETPWHSLAHQTQIALNRLTKRQIGRMLRERLKRDELPDVIVSQVIERTEGVPLFIEEYAKLIEEADLLDDSASATESLVLKVIPETLQDLLVARLDRMSSNPQVVQMAATVGREFSHKMIKAVAGLDDKSLEAELAKLTEAEIVFRKGAASHASYMFKHALIQDAAYDSMLKKKRQENHGAIAAVLERQFPETVEKEPELLAHHFTEAGEIFKGIDYWLKAGKRAQDRSAQVEAIRHLECGLGLVAGLSESAERSQLELEFQLSLGVSIMATSGYANPRVGEVLGRAEALCDEIGPTAPRFPVLWGTWAWRMIRDDLALARGVSNELLEIAEALGDTTLRAEAHLTSACTGTFMGEWPRALRSAEAALADFDLPASRQHMAFTGQNVGVMAAQFRVMNLWYRGYPEQALAAHKEGSALTAEVNHPFSTTCYHWHVGLYAAIARNVSLARELMETGLAIAEEHGYPFWVGMQTMLRGAVHQLEGRPVDAAEAVAAGIAGIQMTGAEVTIAGFQAFQADALRELGRIDEAWQTVEDGLGRGARNGGRFADVDLLLAKTRLLAADQAAAASVAQQAVEVARAQQAPLLEVRAAVALARLQLAQGDRDLSDSPLAQAYAKLTEGFDSTDLQKARELLRIPS